MAKGTSKNRTQAQATKIKALRKTLEYHFIYGAFTSYMDLGFDFDTRYVEFNFDIGVLWFNHYTNNVSFGCYLDLGLNIYLCK